MIIKSKPASMFWLKFGGYCIPKILKIAFVNKLVIKPVEIKPNHSYILCCNHFSFLDGFINYCLAYQVLIKQGNGKRWYIMSLKKQMQQHWWLKYIGAFSIVPGSKSSEESLDYAAEVLNTPGNLLLFYPQGNLESSHVREIEFKDGVSQIVPKIKGDCQLVWCSILMEYFESTKPSVYFNLLDCGTNNDFDFEALKQKVNEHHRQAIQNNIRFTQEPDNHKVH